MKLIQQYRLIEASIKLTFISNRFIVTFKTSLLGADGVLRDSWLVQLGNRYIFEKCLRILKPLATFTSGCLNLVASLEFTNS